MQNKMKKNIEITQTQQDELLNINMTSFREANLLQSIKDCNKWWVDNFLPNSIISKVDRISPLVYEITYVNSYKDEAKSIFEQRNDWDDMEAECALNTLENQSNEQ